MPIVALLMAGALAAPQTPPAKAEAARVYREQPAKIDRCKGGAVMQAGAVASPQARRLGDLPKANLERTVIVMQDGCVKPRVVVHGAGK